MNFTHQYQTLEIDFDNSIDCFPKNEGFAGSSMIAGETIELLFNENSMSVDKKQ